MKAITRDRYGSPDVLRFEDLTPPAPAAGEILVEVGAAGVNRGDALELRGWPYLARLMGYGARRPKHAVIGTDIAGRVVAVGRDVDAIAEGDEVVGWGTGAFAELAVMRAMAAVRRPAGLDTVPAAAVPTTAVTSLQAVRDAGRVQPGQHVLVIGASGGVGTFAVQLAAHFGATVTGVAGASRAALVRSLGATHVVDYRTEDVTTHLGRYDVIVDAVGNHPLGALRRVLTARGTLVVVGGQNPNSLTGMRRFAGAALRSPFTRRRLVPLFSKPNAPDLHTVLALIGSGAVRPVVAATYALPDTAAALQRIEDGHAAGKLVIAV